MAEELVSRLLLQLALSLPTISSISLQLFGSLRSGATSVQDIKDWAFPQHCKLSVSVVSPWLLRIFIMVSFHSGRRLRRAFAAVSHRLYWADIHG